MFSNLQASSPTCSLPMLAGARTHKHMQARVHNDGPTHLPLLLFSPSCPPRRRRSMRPVIPMHHPSQQMPTSSSRCVAAYRFTNWLCWACCSGAAKHGSR